MNPFYALKIFFKVTFGSEFRQSVRDLESGVGTVQLTEIATPNDAESTKAKFEEDKTPKSARNDAVALLAALQREARLIDFLKEDIGAYDDAQVGAAVRDIHKQSAACVDRMFGLTELSDKAEGEQTEVSKGYDLGVVNLVGNVTGEGPYTGIVQHPGWQVTRCDVPEWQGSDDAASVVAPTEVEV